MKKQKVLSLVAAVVLLGSVSLYGGSEGDMNKNVYYGDGAGADLTTGAFHNTFIGFDSGTTTWVGDYNTFLGYGTGSLNETNNNTFLGYQSGYINTTGASNTFVGFKTGFSNSTGGVNTFVGYQAGYSNTSSNYNTFIGNEAGFSNISGLQNTFLGDHAGYSNSTGKFNTFIGQWTGYKNTSGSNNTFLGRQSGRESTGSGNVFLGYYAGYNETGSNKLYIENSDTNTPLIYGEFDNDLVRINGKLEAIFEGPGTESVYRLLTLSANDTDGTGPSEAAFVLNNALYQKEWLFRTINDGTAFTATLGGTGGAEFRVSSPTGHVSGTELYLGNGAKNVGGVWINASSRALKENIKPLSTQEALTAFSKLQPVTYNYKTDKSEKVVGFIAEDVPELVSINSRDGLSSMDMVAVLTKVVAETRAEAKAKDAEMKAMKAEIAKLKVMQQKVAQLESLLTNLALDTSNTPKDIISLKLK